MARFWAKVRATPVDDPNACWLWQAATDGHGYGQFNAGGGNIVKAYAFLYKEMHGPIAPGLELDHLCRVRRCVNPDHLEPVTHQENVARSPIVGQGGGKAQRAKSHCPQGHPYDEANTYIAKGGGRCCRACHRERVKKAKAAKRASRPPRQPQTHCKRGHLFDEANTYRTAAGGRQCRTCNAERALRRAAS